MINLIPPYAKKHILLEYWVRVASVWFYVWSIALTMGAFLLLPPFVLISSQVSVYEASAAAAREKVENYQSVAASLALASQQAAGVVNEIKLPRFSSYVERFTALGGAGVTVTELHMRRGADMVAPVTLSGVAANRQALASFRDRLLGDPAVAVVDLPISNLASDKDIKFTLTVTLTNEAI